MNLSLRQLLLVVLWIGTVGLEIELLFLRHAESFSQIIPHVALAIGLLSTAIITLRPGRQSLRFFQGVMLMFLIIGALGVVLHLKGNIEFATERYPTLAGTKLLWKAIRGATPALAPGALAQLGLLGLVYTHRHPALSNAANEGD
jgi:hypothetical protein